MSRAKPTLVLGLGKSGKAVVRRLLSEGVDVVAADDDKTDEAKETARGLGIEFLGRISPDAWPDVAARFEEVVVSPGIPVSHPVFGLRGSVPLSSEVELAWRRVEVPVIGVTGTNGKTTVVTLATEMLRQAGLHAVSAGNIGVPFIEALSLHPQVVVLEVSSFQLALTETFKPAVGAWLNFSADHLDWHPDISHYRRAKARLWANSSRGDVAVVNAEDPVVIEEAAAPAARGASLVTFGVRVGDWRCEMDRLIGPDKAMVAQVGALERRLPHDLANALSASACAMACGATDDACRRALEAFTGLPHRVALIGEAGGVKFFDDSKATTPGAVLAALEGFDSVVLIAGGRNKGLDLGPLRQAAPRIRSVVAIGEAAWQVAAVFEGIRPVSKAGDMDEAVRRAASEAKPGDAVLLSPGCASFDWYSSYGERGDHFARCVRQLIGSAKGPDDRGRP